MPFMGDGLSTLYQDLLSGSYDGVDRIVLNAYFRMGHDPGGFRLWWRQLTGSDATRAVRNIARARSGMRIRLRPHCSPARSIMCRCKHWAACAIHARIQPTPDGAMTVSAVMPTHADAGFCARARRSDALKPRETHRHYVRRGRAVALPSLPCCGRACRAAHSRYRNSVRK